MTYDMYMLSVHLYMSWYVTMLTDAAVFRRRPNDMMHASVMLLRPDIQLQLHCMQHSDEGFEASQLPYALILLFLCD